MNLVSEIYIATAVYLRFLLLSHVFARFHSNEIFRSYGYLLFYMQRSWWINFYCML